MKLVQIFRKIRNESITVELKTNVSIQGILVEIDKSMNLHLKNAKRSSRKESSVFISEISIRGSTIRYIILPVWLNTEVLLSY